MDLGVITVIIVTILATTFFEHLRFTEHHAKGFLYIISFDYHNDPVNCFFFLIKKLFYWSIVALQCCVSSCELVIIISTP